MQNGQLVLFGTFSSGSLAKSLASTTRKRLGRVMQLGTINEPILRLLELCQRLTYLLVNRSLPHHGGHVLHRSAGAKLTFCNTTMSGLASIRRTAAAQPRCRLHRQRKGRECSRTVVDPFPQSGFAAGSDRGSGRFMTFFLVDRIEKVRRQ